MGVRTAAISSPIRGRARERRVYWTKSIGADGARPESRVRVKRKQDKLVLSVSLTIRRFRALYGVLMMKTESGDIDSILKERLSTALVEGFFIVA